MIDTVFKVYKSSSPVEMKCMALYYRHLIQRVLTPVIMVCFHIAHIKYIRFDSEFVICGNEWYGLLQATDSAGFDL